MEKLTIKTLIAISSAATLALTVPAFAGNHVNAQAMVENIKIYGGNTAAAIRPGSAGAEAFALEPRNSGWGNAGSFATGLGLLADPGNGIGFAMGEQVSSNTVGE